MMIFQWRHSERDGISNHRRIDSLLNRSKKISKLRVTGLCEGNPPVTGGFPSQRASNVENISIWWRHHEVAVRLYTHTFIKIIISHFGSDKTRSVISLITVAASMAVALTVSGTINADDIVILTSLSCQRGYLWEWFVLKLVRIDDGADVCGPRSYRPDVYGQGVFVGCRGQREGVVLILS